MQCDNVMGKMILTARDVYKKLIYEDQILTINGQISFSMGDVGIIVKKKDVVGNILQEWMEGWLIKRNVDFSPNPNTQMPPDIFLDTKNMKRNWMEIKAFNREAAPAFDIADFKAFVSELIEKPYHLDTDFLIFGYKMCESTGKVVVQDLWLKKIWEIMRPMADWPITVQYKNGRVQKMRPGNWYTTTRRKVRMFDSMIDFLSAFEQTVYQNPETHEQSTFWKQKFQKSYQNYYEKEIDFPRWNDIKSKYFSEA